jgi:hypothetical protein
MFTEPTEAELLAFLAGPRYWAASQGMGDAGPEMLWSKIAAIRDELNALEQSEDVDWIKLRKSELRRTLMFYNVFTRSRRDWTMLAVSKKRLLPDGADAMAAVPRIPKSNSLGPSCGVALVDADVSGLATRSVEAVRDVWEGARQTGRDWYQRQGSSELELRKPGRVSFAETSRLLDSGIYKTVLDNADLGLLYQCANPMTLCSDWRA